MSKQVASRGWVCAFCVIPVLAIVGIALLLLAPAGHHRSSTSAAVGTASGTGSLARGRIQASYAALPLAFEQNQGQTDAQVKYMARGNGYTLFLTANDAVFSLRSHSAGSGASAVRRGSAFHSKSPRQRSEQAQKESDAVVRMQLVGGNSLAKVAASGLLPGKSNYFLGRDPSQWHTDVAHYARVSYQDVYPGVNLAYHGAQRQLEFDFVVAPGANPAPIGFHFTGAQGVKTDDSGNLVIASAAGNVLLHKPVAYQEQNGARQAVDARFMLKADNQVSFELGNYDRSRELVIDPSVSYEYSTYLGGSGDDEGEAIAFDSSGNAYVTGQTASSSFPGTSGALPGVANVFVTEVAANGQSLIYSTYVGGSGMDSGNGIALDSSGDAFVAGSTTSSNFPTTSGAFQTAIGSGATGNAFILEIASGGTLTYCTYLGGSGDDVGLGIAFDKTTGVYAVAGSTTSTNFPVTGTPLQGSLSGPGDGFVTVWNSSNAQVYSTYLGGSSDDSINSVALDSSDNAYVTGVTESADFPLSSALYGTFAGGGSDAFVTAINAAGNAYIYSTYLGGSGADAGDGIAVDSTGAYVVGTTESTDFPTTAGVLQRTYGTNTDAFVTKLSLAGSALVYSTYLGGAGFDAGASIAVDGAKNAYVTGQTNSSPFPTVNPTQSALGGGFDAFVSEINSTGSALVFSTYLGGSADEDDGGDYGAIAVDSAGATIYVTGNTASTNFPTTQPYQAANSGGTADAFVVKYAQGPSFTITASSPAPVAPGSSGTSTVTLTSLNGYSSAVNLSCAVTGGGSPAPACSATSFSPDSVTPVASPGATSTLTITTTGASSALFAPSKIFYAMWLPIAGISLMGMGFSTSRSHRKKVLGFLMVAMVMAALFLMPACGGSSSGGGGGGGCSGCTPAGAYTVTITGTGIDANATTASTQVTLTVNSN